MSDNTNQTEERMEDYGQELEASFRKIREGDILTETIIGVSDTEATVDLHYYTEGIIRKEDFTDDPSFNLKTDVAVGDTVSATVIATDDGHGNILLSKKEASQVLAWETLQKMYEDQTTLTVRINGVVNAGVIAYVEDIRGFIPASQLSLEYVEDLNEWLQKEIQVRIITLDKKAGKLVLSARDILKEAASEERARVISNVEVGLVTEGTVETIKPYGAFVRLSNGASGLVHVSQICEKRIKTPAAVLKEGQKVTVKVISVKDGKLSLSMKALQDSSTQDIEEEVVNLPQSESISTNLGSLLSGLKLD